MATNGNSIKINLPKGWIAIFAIPLLGLGSLQLHSSTLQGDIVERALLVHSQDIHKGTASANDVERMQYIQESLGSDVTELNKIVKELAVMQRELIFELRTMRDVERTEH